LKNRYFVQLSFKGTNYAGWQIQPGKTTVQEVLNSSLSILLRDDIRTTGAGRTDTGVHAEFFAAHFDTSAKEIDADFIYRLNGILPIDIAVQKIYTVNHSSHSRFNAVSRTYEYRICRKKNPFYYGLAYYFFNPLDITLMNEACNILMKYNDFTSFSKLHGNAKNNLCKIYHAGWTEAGDLLVFTIKADRFLRNMVRAITGTMLDLGKGKTNIDHFRNIIEAKNRCAAGISVPAKGLFLVDIEYPF
jgi:tRNA pseudouridine38-40 synthase